VCSSESDARVESSTTALQTSVASGRVLFGFPPSACFCSCFAGKTWFACVCLSRMTRSEIDTRREKKKKKGADLSYQS
jgi:hypothetical protein